MKNKMQAYIIETSYVFNSLNSPKLWLNSLGKREWQAGIHSAYCLHNRRWEPHYASCFAQE